MYLFKRNPDPRQKPPVGSILNPDHPLSKGLVGCWLINEGGGDKVYNVARPGSFNLTASGDFSFEGGDGLFGGTNGKLSVGPIGVDDDLSAYHRETTIVANFKFNSIVNLAPIFFRDGDIGFRPNSSNPEYFIWGCNAIGTTTLSTGVEYQVAIVFDGNITVKGYLNGVTEVSLTNGNTQTTYNNDFEVGSRTALSLYFNGVIKNLSYYRGMLTDSEILQLYEEPYGHILAPQYWYMVDFGAAAGGTTITLIKMSQDWQGQDIKLNMNITTPAFGMSWTGKSAKANLAITLAKMTQSWVGKALYANKLITLARIAITWTGKNILLEKIIHPAKMALSWAGKTITINGGALGRRFLGLYRRIIGDLIR